MMGHASIPVNLALWCGVAANPRSKETYEMRSKYIYFTKIGVKNRPETIGQPQKRESKPHRRKEI